MNPIAYDIKTGEPITPERSPEVGEYGLWVNGEKKVIKQFHPQPVITPKPIEKMVEIGDMLNIFPLGTKRKLFNLAKVDNPDGDIADLILSFLQIGKPVNVNGQNFLNQAAWMVNNPTLDVEQSHIDEIRNL